VVVEVQSSREEGVDELAACRSGGMGVGTWVWSPAAQIQDVR